MPGSLQAAADVKVMDRHGALKFVQSSKGCLVRDLAAAYPGAPDDLAKLKAEGLIWILPAAEKEQEAVFAAEKPPLISVSTDIMKLWHQVEVKSFLQAICCLQKALKRHLLGEDNGINEVRLIALLILVTCIKITLNIKEVACSEMLQWARTFLGSRPCAWKGSSDKGELS